MAREAERLLDGTGWLPDPLRMIEATQSAAAPAGPAFLAEDAGNADPGIPRPRTMAAE